MFFLSNKLPSLFSAFYFKLLLTYETHFVVLYLLLNYKQHFFFAQNLLVEVGFSSNIFVIFSILHIHMTHPHTLKNNFIEFFLM